MNSAPLDHWRKFFTSARCADIFELIEYAIEVAASDYPDKLRLKRDRIAERLFSCRLAECSGQRIEVRVPEAQSPAGEALPRDKNSCLRIEGGVADIDRSDSLSNHVAGFHNGSKVVADRVKMASDDVDHNSSDCIDREAEELSDEIEAALEAVDEVMRIKNLLLNCPDESESVLYESLKKLELIVTKVDMLKATEIGKAVNGFRKHNSEKLRNIARILINGWKDMVDQWYESTQSTKADEGTPESYPSTVDDEEGGLPSPPLEDGVFFATDPSGIEFSQLFDGMDDDLNGLMSGEVKTNSQEINKKSSELNKNNGEIKKKSDGELNKNSGIERKSQNERNAIRISLKPLNQNAVRTDNRHEEVKKEVSTLKPTNQSSASVKPQKPKEEFKSNNAVNVPQRANLPKRSHDVPQEKLKCSDEAMVQKKFEATKRKLQESYHQAEIAKKQRTTQVVEFKDIPKQSSAGSKKHPPPKTSKYPPPKATKLNKMRR